MIMQVCDEINDHRYVTNIPEFKKKSKPKAASIVAEKTGREVKQLYLVHQQDEFVIDGIVHELLYKDFREIYTEQKEVEIINLEQNAFENYSTVLFSLENSETKSPQKVFQATIQTPIGGNLLPDGPVYRKGCYIYLTRDDVASENQITWGEEND